jgi:hypothetical protein
MPHRDRALWALAIVVSIALLTAPAIWNGFPLLQWDTGGYLARWYEGTLVISRAVIYGLMLRAGVPFGFWPVLLLQSALTIWIVALTLRTHGLGRRPMLLLGVIAALSVLTTLPWLTSILLTDIFCGLGVLALYLLLMRADALRRAERISLIALIAVSAATHNATLAVLMALTAAAALLRLIDRRRMPLARLGQGVMALIFGAMLVLGADYVVAKRLAWTPGGFALSFGRMLQDGIVKKYLDTHCPDPQLRLCAVKDQLPHDADVWFWGSDLFDKLGRFDDRATLPGRLSGLANQDHDRRHRPPDHRHAHRRRRAQFDLAHLRHHRARHAATRCRHARRPPAARRHLFRGDQRSALPAGALMHGAAPAHRVARLARRAACRDRRTGRDLHAGAARQCLHLRRALQSTRPLRRPHGLARRLHRGLGARARR